MALNQPVTAHSRILNWNANGLKSQVQLLSEFLSRHDISIACVSETHLTPADRLRLPGYSIFRQDRDCRRASGGVLIAVRRNILHGEVQLPDMERLEAVAIQVSLENGRQINIVSAYQRPNLSLSDNDLRNVLSGPPTLVIGDLNSKHVAWGCRVTNPNGRRLLDFVNGSGAVVTAPDEPTFYPSQQHYQPDILDICILNNFHFPVIHTQLTELNSDHLPILLTFTDNIRTQPPLPKLIQGKIDWDCFREDLDLQFTIPITYDSTDDIDLAVRTFTDCVCESVRRSTVRQYRDPRTNRQTYNTLQPELNNMIRDKNRLRKRWQRTRDAFDKRQWNQLTRLVRLELDKHRINKYRDYLTDMTPGDPNLWKETRRILQTNYTIPPLQSTNGQLVTTDADKAEVLAEYLQTKFTPQNITDPDTAAEVQESLTSDYHSAELPIKFILPSEVKRIVKKLPSRKAPGRDAIPNIVLRELSSKGIAYLTSIFNASLRLGYFPAEWKSADVIVFPKPGKPKHDPSSYRPISLLSGVSKLFEKLIHVRLQAFFDSANLLPAHQFGFRAKYSTTLQLQRLTELIVNGFETKRFTSAVSLDVSAAFDTVWHDGLLFKLRQAGVPVYLFNVLRSYLSSRTFRLRVNGSHSSDRPAGAGVPQGSVLGPCLFIIYCFDMPNPENALLATYADDTLLLAQNHDLGTAITDLQNATTELSDWYTKWNLTLNSDKTQTKIFALRKINPQTDIHLNNTSIRWLGKDEPLRYLGVDLDTRLTYKHHTNRRLTLAYTRLTKLYPMMNRHTPLRTDCTLLLYKSLLRPLLTYACPVWFGASSTVKRKLEVFQNKVLRMAVGAPWFVRNEQLRCELGVDTLEEHLKQLTLRHFSNLPLYPATEDFHLGWATVNRRLRPRLPQDILEFEF